MADATIDDSAWPLVVVVNPPEMSTEEYQAYLARLLTLLDRGERFAVLIDARTKTPISPKDRQRTADLLRTSAPRAKRYLAGAGVVLSSNLQRGMLTAILWLYTPPFPIRVFADAPAALMWLRDQLAREGGEGEATAT